MSRALRSGICCLATLLAANVQAADWPAFRGPHGDGTTEATSVPVKWSATDSIRWKVKLPQPGNGSAIVVGPRVFVTSAEDSEGKQRSLYAFDLQTGKQLWKETVTIDRVMPTHKTNPYAGSTPASDGNVVVVWHATGGLHCYDVEGRPLWHREFGEFKHIWGYGSSPIIEGDRVFLHTGPGQKVFLVALDLKTGDTLWQQEEPVDGDGSNTTDKRYFGSWATPVMTTVNGQRQLILSMPKRLNAYDPATGQLLWSSEGMGHKGGDLSYSSPIVVGELVFITAGFGGPAMGVKLGGTGDVTASHRLWRNEKNPQSIGTGVVVDGYVYRPNAGPGTIQCIDPTSGRVLWENRAGGGDHWASIVLAGGLAYATNQNGTTVVFRPSPEKYDEVAQNKLDEHTNATPAIVDGAVVIRTFENLVCIQSESR
ncbi:MAG TPA: PQQ-binding-like beta-propeller repeat protein [Caulifigura sp.]|nr:PQQ-binding-like beta-propeller repeat protein [Caulifigura sp.]